MEEERLGKLAFITPSGYRVYTPLTFDNLKWVSRSSVGGSSKQWKDYNVDPSIAHYTSKLPENFIPAPNSGNTNVCIGWSSNTGQGSYKRNLEIGRQIHFVALDPGGRFSMLMTFDIDSANGKWRLSQAVDSLDKPFLTSNLKSLNSNAEKNNAITLGREFLSGARGWAENPQSEGPVTLTKSWKTSSDQLWKRTVPPIIGTDKELQDGQSKVITTDYFSGLNSATAMQLPYTTSVDGTVK